MIEAQPSRTAMRVALRRAAHQLVDSRPLVLDDPFAVTIVGKEALAELQRTPGAERRPYSAAMRAWMVARSRFAEDVLAAAAARWTETQYLVLGAGLDTFALRNPFQQTRVFEVDYPATQAWKQKRLQEAGLPLPAGTSLVAVNFEQHNLRSALLDAGFRMEVPTVTAWLGVVPYLTSTAFQETCQFLATFSSGSEVVFDYGQPRSVLPPIEQMMQDSLAARVAQAGEPFQLWFTPEELQSQLAGLGLDVVEDLGCQALNDRFFAGRTDGLALRGTVGRLCRAQARSS